MAPTDPEALDRLVAAVTAGPKYREVCGGLVRRLGSLELGKRRGFGEAVKATKSKLHQVAGAYLDRPTRYRAWLEELVEARASGGPEALVGQCRRILGCHASSRERLAALDSFYPTILGDLAPVRSVLDLGCGLNPLAIPWMPLAESAEYHAVDVYRDLAEFLKGALALMPVRGSAEAKDALSECPQRPVEVALALKLLPCLEQTDRGAGRRVLEAVPARHLVISFPRYSLGGQAKGMSASYEAYMDGLVRGGGYSLRRFEFPTELVFRVSR